MSRGSTSPARTSELERTYQLLEAEGFTTMRRHPSRFVEYWLGQGKRPEEIVEIALGRTTHRKGSTTQTMSPQHNIIRESRPFSRVSAPAEDEATRFGAAMGELTLAIANADRALRGQPPVASPLDLHPLQAERYHAAGLEAVLRQQPAAVLAAVNDAAGELLTMVHNTVDADGAAAIRRDSERLQDACAAWVRRTLDAFRASLAVQLPGLRGQS